MQDSMPHGHWEALGSLSLIPSTNIHGVLTVLGAEDRKMNETWPLPGRNLQIIKGRHVAERLTELVTFAVSLQSLER